MAGPGAAGSGKVWSGSLIGCTRADRKRERQSTLAGQLSSLFAPSMAHIDMDTLLWNDGWVGVVGMLEQKVIVLSAFDAGQDADYPAG